MTKRFLYEFGEMRKELRVVEYALWWFLRACMIATAVYFEISDRPVYTRNLILLNLLATFAIPILRYISPRKLFTSKITFRIQTYIDIFVLLGSFFGHGLNFLNELPEYDKFMHFVAGGVVVFIGAEIIKAFSGHEKVSAGIKTFCGVGFSFMFVVLWEIMEFIADWTITDSSNQGYTLSVSETDLFVKIFGFGKNYPANAPVYDTNVDMLYATVGCIIFGVILYIFLANREKKSNLKKSTEKETVLVK